MRWLDALERRFGSWSIPNFPLFIAAANGTIFILANVRPGFEDRLLLIPSAVLRGEVWRVVTFLFVPPMMQPIWILFWLYLLYYYAQALEHEWGEFRFGVFYLLGATATVIAALAFGASLSNVPLNTTLFLAFATLYPDFQLLLFFFIPVKVKYISYFIWATLVWSLITGTLIDRVAIGASLLNYAIFFGPGLVAGARLRWEVYLNRKRFRR